MNLQTARLAIAIVVSVSSGSRSAVMQEETEFDYKLYDKLLHLDVYDRRLRPRPPEGGPTVVTIDTYLRSIHSIDEVAMEFAVDLVMRQQWTDGRLALNASAPGRFVVGSGAEARRLWASDLFFHNARRARLHDVTRPNTMLRLHADGRVMFNARYSLVLACHMHLAVFPFDSQRCHLQLGSFAFTEESLQFRWKHEQPVTVNPQLQLAKFQLRGFDTVLCRNEHYTGNFSCLKLELRFDRLIGFHVVQTYVPNVLLVVASFVSFWLDVDAIPARITLGVTALLTTAAQSESVKQTLPTVSYTKAIDVWIMVCTFFVFGALIEFAIVNLVSRHEVRVHHTGVRVSRSFVKSKRSCPPALQKGKEYGNGPSEAAGNGEMLPSGYTYNEHVERAPESAAAVWFDKPRARTIDKCARVAFPAAFAAFVAFYLLYYGVHRGSL